jgi:pyruvate formate lyase activating enzyme
MEGKVHSTYMGGMVDGPGIRYVLFLAGCMLRCKYCHNPDTWDIHSGKSITVNELVSDIGKYNSYLRFSGGGVTVTGGEPFMQPGFLEALLKAFREKKWHTALCTSGYASRANAERVLGHTDLVLLDIKAFDEKIHKDVTGASNKRVLDFLRLCEEMAKIVWVRFVLVPGLTDDPKDIKSLADFLHRFDCVEKIDVLPFHKTGEYKWADLNLPYTLENVQPPSTEDVERVRGILSP